MLIICMGHILLSGRCRKTSERINPVSYTHLLGDGRKHVSPSEAKNKAIARKSIVAAKPIQKGEVFTEENITTKRPGDGVSPMRWHQVLGMTAKRDFAEDEKIEL